jgi:hypothetical protein
MQRLGREIRRQRAGLLIWLAWQLTELSIRLLRRVQQQPKEGPVREIWKWKVPLEGLASFELEIPGFPTFLTCQLQDGRPVFWAVVEPEARRRHYKFRVMGTGLPFRSPEDWRYIGTFQLGEFVGHLFVDGGE